jgi:catechol 2,3-dioxygenase-like lactoylglutathione lyase family enzyme
MEPNYRYDHMHLRTHDRKGTAEYYRRMFDARVLETTQSDGKPRVDVDLAGLKIAIEQVSPESDSSAPTKPILGLDHFGLRVDDLDVATAELKRRGADFIEEPHTIRPGVKIAVIAAPDNVRLEILERVDRPTS